MDEDETKAFERTKSPRENRPQRERAWPEPKSAWEERRETMRVALLWITVSALAIAVLTFLISVNSVISIWFRSQWAPVARSVAALAVIALCLYVMTRLLRRESGVPK